MLLILVFFSELSTYITGQVLQVDGGMLTNNLKINNMQNLPKIGLPVVALLLL